MKTKIYQLIEGAKKAEGLVVIIDVFRAFSTACYVSASGAEKIIPVGKIETAFQLKDENSDFILIGERDGKKLKGFDFGNSPSLIRDVDFKGKTVVHTTSAGTQGIVKAEKADEIITGSFVNAGAVAEYIKRKNPEQVSLVSMGTAGVKLAVEDTLCANYIKGLIEDSFIDRQDKMNYQNDVIKILRIGNGMRFFDPANKAWSPSADFQMCLEFEIFDFILKACNYKNDLTYLKKIKI
ncbi:MAG: 2-phosphosulfolactate phosphatase [Halanaerobiaceae bacterium]